MLDDSRVLDLRAELAHEFGGLQTHSRPRFFPDALRLLRRKRQAAHHQLTHLFGFPSALHDSRIRVTVVIEQQVADLVDHDTTQDYGHLASNLAASILARRSACS
jgi:hypothetical protein